MTESLVTSYIASWFRGSHEVEAARPGGEIGFPSLLFLGQACLELDLICGLGFSLSFHLGHNQVRDCLGIHQGLFLVHWFPLFRLGFALVLRRVRLIGLIERLWHLESSSIEQRFYLAHPQCARFCRGWSERVFHHRPAQDFPVL